MRISDWSSDVCSSDLLSPSAITILQGDPLNMIHWEIRDANGNSLGGNAHIPLPDNWTYEEDKLRLRNENVDNRSIRVAYIWGGRDQDGAIGRASGRERVCQNG